MSSKTLLKIWRSGMSQVSSRLLLQEGRRRWRQEDAYLFLGKAAQSQALAVLEQVSFRRDQVFGVSPDPISPELLASGEWWRGNHPLPGRGSFLAGRALIEFFERLRMLKVRRLFVFLSGGTSSLIWFRPMGLTARDLSEDLSWAYRQSWNIDELNQWRSQRCQLKKGGAAELLRLVAPRVRAEVLVVSDVDPFGVDVVGSGPFFDGEVPHRVLASSQTLVHELAREAKANSIRVDRFQSGCLEPVEEWLRFVPQKPGMSLVGGEPRLNLSYKRPGLGGRLSHLSALLLRTYRDKILSGELSFLCMTTDGVDGRSGCEGYILDRERVRSVLKKKEGAMTGLQGAISQLNTGEFLLRRFPRVCLRARPSGTNLQDVLMAWRI